MAERIKRLIKVTEVRKQLTIQHLKMGNSHIFDICVLHRQILHSFFSPKTTQLQKINLKSTLQLNARVLIFQNTRVFCFFV